MAGLIPFAFGDNLVRVHIDESGNPWWVAKDVCRTLEIVNHNDALCALDDDEKGVAITDTLGGPQEVVTINEPGLYSLVLRSRKPEAKVFKRWLTHEVIPSIRKNGRYSAPQESLSSALNASNRSKKLVQSTPQRYEKVLKLLACGSPYREESLYKEMRYWLSSRRALYRILGELEDAGIIQKKGLYYGETYWVMVPKSAQ